MAGESHLMEQAKKQWEKLNAEGHKIINDLLTTEAERIEWPANTEPKFTRKRGTKMTKVAYDTKTKKYTYFDKTVPAGEPTRLHIPDSYIYFSYHPAKKEYVVVNTPNRLKPDTKYVITAPYCHWIQERSITVLALLSYAIRNAHLTKGVVKTAIKDAHTEEALCQRIAEQECYTELVQTITTAITDISAAENPLVGYKNKIDEISGVIEFIREKRVKPSCKILSEDTVFSDFQTAAKDTTTMDLARDIVNTKMSVDGIVKQWRNQHNNEIRSRNKSKQRELFEKRWGEYLAPPRNLKDPETSSVISMGSNTTATSAYQKEQQITDY